MYVFVPFTLALTVANLYAELSSNLTFARVQYTILLSAAFALPAVVLFFARTPDTAPPLYFRYWQLFWTFGFVGYSLHFYYSVGAWFDWDFSQICRRQGCLVMTTNCLLLILWAVDVFLALRGPSVGGLPGRIVRWAAHVLFVVAFVVASVVFRSDVRTTSSLVLGVLLLIVTAVSLLLRWWQPPEGRPPSPGHLCNPLSPEALAMSVANPNPVEPRGPQATTGGEPNPALERRALTRPNLFVILYQAYKDFVGKDVQQTTTYSYVWSADQGGHIMLGFVPTFLMYGLAAFLASVGLTVSLFGFTFHQIDQIVNCAVLVMGVWTALETWDFIDSSIKIRRSSGYFEGNYLELLWNVVTALFYFGVGATIAGAFSWGGAVAFQVFLGLLLPGLVIAFLWVRTKILFQRAGLPFLYRIPNYDGVLDFSKAEATGPVPAPLEAAITRRSEEVASQMLQRGELAAASEPTRRAVRAYVHRKMRAAAGDVVRQSVGRAAAEEVMLAAEQEAGRSDEIFAAFAKDRQEAIAFINEMRAAPIDPLHTYAPGADAAVPRQHLIVAGPQNSGKTSLAVGIGTEFAFRFPSGGIGRYMTMSDLVQIIDARAAQNLNAAPPGAGAGTAATTPAGFRNGPESSRLINADPKNNEFNDGRVLWKWASTDLLIVDDVVELLLPVRRAIESRIRGGGFRASIEQLVADHTDLSQRMIDGKDGMTAFFDEHLEAIRSRLEGLASPEAVGRYVADSYGEVIEAIKRIPRVVWVLGDMILPELFEAFIRTNFGSQTESVPKLKLLTVRLLPSDPPPTPSWLTRNWTQFKNWLASL